MCFLAKVHLQMDFFENALSDTYIMMSYILTTHTSVVQISYHQTLTLLENVQI